MIKKICLMLYFYVLCTTLCLAETPNEFLKLFELATVSNEGMIMCHGGFSWGQLQKLYYNQENDQHNKIELIRNILINDLGCKYVVIDID